MGAFVEKFYPLFLGIIASIIYYIFFKGCPLSIRLKDILLATVNISAIAVGFLAASQSIILTMHGRRVIRQAKTSGLYNMLVKYMIFATYSCFFLAVLSAVGLLLDLDHQANWYHWAFLVWLLLGVTSFFSFYRVIRLLGKILLLE